MRRPPAARLRVRRVPKGSIPHLRRSWCEAKEFDAVAIGPGMDGTSAAAWLTTGASMIPMGQLNAVRQTFACAPVNRFMLRRPLLRLA